MYLSTEEFLLFFFYCSLLDGTFKWDTQYENGKILSFVWIAWHLICNRDAERLSFSFLTKDIHTFKLRRYFVQWNKVRVFKSFWKLKNLFGGFFSKWHLAVDKKAIWRKGFLTKNKTPSTEVSWYLNFCEHCFKDEERCFVKEVDFFLKVGTWLPNVIWNDCRKSRLMLFEVEPIKMIKVFCIIFCIIGSVTQSICFK